MRISDLSSDVCSSDLRLGVQPFDLPAFGMIKWWTSDPDCGPAPVNPHENRPDRWRYSAEISGVIVSVLSEVAKRSAFSWIDHPVVEIGRASCRERVCQYV